MRCMNVSCNTLLTCKFQWGGIPRRNFCPSMHANQKLNQGYWSSAKYLLVSLLFTAMISLKSFNNRLIDWRNELCFQCRELVVSSIELTSPFVYAPLGSMGLDYGLDFRSWTEILEPKTFTWYRSICSLNRNYWGNMKLLLMKK